MQTYLVSIFLFLSLLQFVYYGLLTSKAGSTLPVFLVQLLSAILILFSIFSEELAGPFVQIPLADLGSGIFLKIELITDFPAAVMLVLIALVSLAIHTYALFYMKQDDRRHRFFGHLGLFVFAMYILVLSNSIVVLFFAWELLGLASYLLVAHYRNSNYASGSASKVIWINKIGDALLLGGLILLALQADSFSISEIKMNGSSDGSLGVWLMLLGAMVKSAQYPFSIWLLKAMAGPTPVSAFLHSATMVVAGLLVVIKFLPVLNAAHLQFLSFLGVVTALLGGFAALFQYDIKKILAFSSISQLGFMLAGLGSGIATVALGHIFVHGFFKAGLFMFAGVLSHHLEHDKNLNTDQSRNIRNMRLNPSQNKLLLVFILVLALSLSGFPGTGAFLTKDLIIATFFSDATFNSSPILGFGLVLAAAFTSFYISRLAYFIFFKKGVEIGKKIVMNWQYIGAMGLLVLLCPFFTGTWLFDFLRQDIESLEIESISKSIFIPLIGFSAAVSGPFLFFVWNRSGEKKLSNPFLEQFSMQLFGEKLYDAIGKASLRLGSIFNFLDQKIWDGIIHLLASAQVLLAEVLSFVDRYVIDGFTYIISGVFKGIGSGLIGLQSQKLRWLFMVIGFTVLCFLIFVAL